MLRSQRRLGVAGLAASGFALRKLGIRSAAAAPADGHTMSGDLPVVYQYKICPFCSKVKALLDHLKEPYSTVEVNPLTKSEIGFSKEHRKVPILVRNGVQVNESDAIIEYLTKELKVKDKLGARFFPADSDKWATWCDKKLAVMLYPNITRSMAESWECFGYVDNVKSWNVTNQFVTRAAGAVAMSLANGRIKKKYNIADERGELKATLAEWTGAVGDKKYLHGDYVTLPDLLVFGVLRSISGLTTFKEIMAENTLLRSWYERMDAALPSMAIA